METPRITPSHVQQLKRMGQKIVLITAHDYEMARLVDYAGPEIVLVARVGGRHQLGHADFNATTLEEMILMTRSVRRGVKRAMVVGDLSILRSDASPAEAVETTQRLVAETGADGVKMEGRQKNLPRVRAVIEAGVPVLGNLSPIGHVAGQVTPRDSADVAEQVRTDAFGLQEAGAFAIMLSGVPPALAASVTRELTIPTIAGLGSGDDCDGQVGVFHSVFGLTLEEVEEPRALYGPLAPQVVELARSFIADVRAGKPVRSRRDADEQRV